MMTAREMTAATAVDIPVRAAADRAAAIALEDAARRAAIRADVNALRAKLAGRVDAYIASK